MNILGALKNIRAIVLDVDGVLTDGSLLLTEDGHMLRRMNIKDGYAIQLAVKKNYLLVVLSGSHSVAVIKRLEKLGVKDIRMEVKDKAAILTSLIGEYDIKPGTLLYMGDDMPDIPAMKRADVSCCPADAAAEVKESAHYISPMAGGQGCVRDVIEKILKLNQHWLDGEGLSSI